MSARNSGRQGESEPGFVSAAREDHQSLRGRSADLRAVCSRPEIDVDLIVEIGQRLAAFHVDLVAHFEREERDGYFEALVEERPELATRVSALLDQHGAIRSELGELTNVMAGDPQPELLARVLKLLDVLDSHEQGETALLQHATLTDLGGGVPG